MARLVKPLTATQVQNAKPKESIYKLFDGGGLFLQVTPAGGKHWKLKYRRDDGKEGLLSFGTYPDVSLEQARKKRDEARAQRAAPSRPKRISRSRPQRSATRLNGISNSAIVPVPAVTLRLTVPAEIPKASLSCGSSGCVP